MSSELTPVPDAPESEVFIPPAFTPRVGQLAMIVLDGTTYPCEVTQLIDYDPPVPYDGPRWNAKARIIGVQGTEVEIFVHTEELFTHIQSNPAAESKEAA